jgi:hypothetical protein
MTLLSENTTQQCPHCGGKGTIGGMEPPIRFRVEPGPPDEYQK